MKTIMYPNDTNKRAIVSSVKARRYRMVRSGLYHRIKASRFSTLLSIICKHNRELSNNFKLDLNQESRRRDQAQRSEIERVTSMISSDEEWHLGGSFLESS